RVALDLLFPPQCAVCRAGGSVLCDLCVALLPLAEPPRCVRCWDDIRTGSRCPPCAAAPPAFVAVRSPYVHADAARDLVHLFKYEGLTSLARPMASLMVASARALPADLVVPVPLHRGRQRARGYNQATLLAGHLARDMGLPCDPRAARRIRATKPLAKSMSREERSSIVAGAFGADPVRAEGRVVLLVDDVVTTGATLDACARALLDAGARQVRAVTFVHA
ncbi:MAG TPA: phosphoribosyltransferase family protein, partial [Dehalococcoidia bacterium]|nr:phosphoribosyltransferase family protein [Dehalococcoidia bacterium]